ncbi:MAG: YihA family ribosome biogenesis GTP-binding protein [Campylobacteraceae bacterium]|nr:YihA family ribosome biogenesis GTP-binding protein [Campylobacteraceae bacterium]
MVRVVDSYFLTSAPSIKEVLPEGTAEVAFLGRSNVGKSSLINALTNHKNLAKKSSTPGKTRLINFFKIIYNTEDKKSVHFVDLPGFGYAKVSKSEQGLWERNLTTFVEKRLSIRLFLLLVDARHPNLQIDKDVEEYLLGIKRGDQKVVKVFTKIDKLNQKEISKLKREYPDSLMISNLKKRGLEKLNEFIFITLLGEWA